MRAIISLFERLGANARNDEKGQSIVIVAFAFVGIMALVGLSIDVAHFYVRAAQFTAAVDSATTAGVVELRENASEEAAYLRAAQFLTLNGWPVSTSVFTDTEYSFIALGAPQFTLTVTWPMPLNFMQLLGFNTVNLTRSASAALIARPEVFTPTSFEWGVARKANQFAFGPAHCTRHGDPVAPLWADNGVENPFYRVPQAQGVHQYRIRVGQRYVDTYGNTVRIELFDPDTYNSNVSAATVEHSAIYQDPYYDGGPPTSNRTCSVLTPGASCVLNTDEVTGLDGVPAGERLNDLPYHNPFWFLRVDEGWSTSQACPGGPDQISAVSPVQTRFDLYYYDISSGVAIRTPIAQYTTEIPDAAATDLRWVSPGDGSFSGAHAENFGSFEVDISAIPLDVAGFQQVYLDVTTLNGYSKNAFDVWARPPDGNYDGEVWNLPSNINDRNLHILNDLFDTPSGKYDIADLDVFALGRMPLNAYPLAGWGDVSLALVPVDQELQVSSAFANLFDYDNSGQDVRFEVILNDGDGDPDTTDYGEREITCDGGSCDNAWSYMTVSNDLNFGILVASYPTGGNPPELDYPGQPEAHTWSLILSTGAPILTR